MSLFDKTTLKEWPGGYLTGTYEALSQEGVLAKVRARRRQLSQMTTALDPESAKRRIPEGDYQISRKVDGEFTCLVWQDGEICTLNPGGTLRAGAPFLDEAAARLKGIKSALIGGELYVQRPDGKRPRVHDVVRVARNPQDAEEVATLAFAVFDIYELDGADLSLSYEDSLAQMRNLFEGGTRIHPVETVAGEGASAVLKSFKNWVIDQGEEGVVARSPTAGIYKVKPRHSLDLAVVGFSESIGDREGLLHDLLVAIVRPTQRYQLVGKVGGGFSDQERSDLLKLLNTQVADSDFREVNSDRVAYQMIKPGMVIEIECLDLVSQTSRGNTIDKMVLEWGDDGWSGVRRLPLVSILSPQFVRVRDDKTPSDSETGIAQLSAVVDIPEIDRAAAEVKLPKSTIIARAVATKTAKEKTMLRKVMAIETNKAEVASDFPAFVLYITDFSPNRATKLQSTVKVSVDRDQILELFEDAKKDLFKKGWVEA